MKTICLPLLCASLVPPVASAALTCTPTNNSILFGNYNPLGTAVVDSTASFVVTCLNTGNQNEVVDFAVALSGQALRQLAPAAGTDRINYNVYTNTLRTTVWGDGANGTATLIGTLTVAKKSSASTAPIFYYGRITPGQDVSATASGSAPSTYSQSLTMTVTCSQVGRSVNC